MLLHEEITDVTLKCFFDVYNELGYGFLEKVYENALMMELISLELFADIMVERCVIIEVKAAEGIAEEHEYQLINYLKATKIEVGLLLNFGKTPQFKRKFFSNQNKTF